jgi:hypothetical protein
MEKLRENRITMSQPVAQTSPWPVIRPQLGDLHKTPFLELFGVTPVRWCPTEIEVNPTVRADG